MKKKRKDLAIILILICISLIAGCLNKQIIRQEETFTYLMDEPAIRFANSQWSYTNTTNPYILTPDYLTNAMIGISRYKSGEEFFSTGKTLPETLSLSNIKDLMISRIGAQSISSDSVVDFNNKPVVVVEYTTQGEKGKKRGIDFGFELEGHLVHVLCNALPGEYFTKGETIAKNIVSTMEAIKE